MAATEHAGIPVDPSKFNQAIAAMRKRAPVPQDDWDRLAQEEQDRAMNVGAMAQGDLVQGIFDALDRAVRDGDTFEDFKAQVAVDVEDQWGGEDSPRLETIFRTNVLGAYNEGREEIFNDPAVKEARPYWRWELIDDGSQSKDDPCLDCEDVVLPADDPWWDEHPRPLHINCRCTFTAITAEEAGESGETDDPPGTAPGALDSDDWEPDPGRFDPSIRNIVEDRLR